MKQRRQPGFCSGSVTGRLLLLSVASLFQPCSAGSARLRRRLSLAGLRRAGSGSAGAEDLQGHKDLYGVDLHFDVQDMQTSNGLTMQFDAKVNKLRLELGITPLEGLAWGRFDDHIDETGWSELFVETTDKASVSNDVKVYAAGYVEGVLTSVRISEFNANSRMLLEKKNVPQALMNARRHLRSQLQHLKSRININGMRIAEEPSDPYLKQVRYVFFQMWGLCDGYNKVARHYQVRQMDLEDVLLLNVGGELQQLLEAFDPEAVTDRAKSKPLPVSFLQSGATELAASQSSRSVGPLVEDQLDDKHWERRVMTSGHCSALVRLAGGRSDLLMGHATWDDYSKMTRIFKYYKFHLQNAATVATQIAFSSYPGLVSSTDDFYVMDSGLSVMDTSLIILDPRAWNSIAGKPTIPTFMHLMAVNRMARTAPDWAQMFLSMITGTYTSQWMVVDYNQFQPSQPVGDNTFWVVEVVPGMAHAEDMSRYLASNGFFPSFNRPFFDSTREASGHSKAEASNGDLYSWAHNPRAKLFHLRAASVNEAGDMRGLMAANLYPKSGETAGHEISARMDLLPSPAAMPNGGIDVKVVNRCLLRLMTIQASSGPSHETLPPFRWLQANGGAEVWPGFPHIGMPTVWDFGFVQISPAGAGPISDGLADTC